METVESNKLIAEFMGSRYINEPFKANKADEHLTDFWHWTKPTDGYPRCPYTNQEWSTAVSIGNFGYHTSWDWLMPVVEKIKTEKEYRFIASISDCQDNWGVGYQINFFGGFSNWKVFYWQPSPDLLDEIAKTPKGELKFRVACDSYIQCVYSAVLQFINWYNQNKA